MYSVLARSTSTAPFVKTVGLARQIRIPVERDAQGNDTTPDIKTFLEKGSRWRPKPVQDEETGKDIELTGYIATIENFFEMKGSKYHEILFVHKGEFVNEEDKKIEYTLKNLEGKDYLQYEWLDISKIDEYPLWPLVIKDVIKENKFPVHKIFKDNK